MNGIKGILFDFGGTLDTNGTHWGIMLQEAYREVGFSLEDKIFREIYVQGERQLAAQPVIATNDTFREVLQKKLAIELDYGVTHGFLSDNTDTRNRMALIAEKCYATARDHIDGVELLRQSICRIGRLRPKKLFRYRYRIGMRRDSQTQPGNFQSRPRYIAAFSGRSHRRGRQLQKRHRSRPFVGYHTGMAQRPGLERQGRPQFRTVHHLRLSRPDHTSIPPYLKKWSVPKLFRKRSKSIFSQKQKNETSNH